MKYIYLLMISLAFSCQPNQTSNNWDTSVTDSFAFEWSGTEIGINKLYVKSDSEGNGYVKLVYHGQNEMHFGKFTENPNKGNFSFVPNQSMSATLQKSLFYEKNTLDIYPKNIKEPLAFEIKYNNIEKSVSKKIRNKELLIKLKAFKNKEEAMVTIKFLDSKFKLEPLTFNYYYTGIEIKGFPEFDKLVFEKLKAGSKETLKLSLEKNGEETFPKNYIRN